MFSKFDPKDIAKKWQDLREKYEVYKSVEDKSKPKFFVPAQFPYPSGEGLHTGHTKVFSAADVLARFKMLQGYSVLNPMGWDAFGLPAENYAMKNKVHPSVAVAKNIEVFKNQCKIFGGSFDWDREINTTDPSYYKWTQWIFLKLYESYFDEKENKAKLISELEAKIKSGEIKIEKDKIKEYIDGQRLAFIDYKPINRCPKCMTGLANEDLEDGKCERCGSEIEQKPMRQWVLRITKYAERLFDGLDAMNWDKSLIELEKNWIGKSVGTEFEMKIDGQDSKFSVFTTRVDTVYGMSFVVMAPEHSLVNQITTDEYKDEVDAYVNKAKNKTSLQRQSDKEKTGVFTGAYAINPFNGRKIPVYIADYVLAEYGTGVVMAVPAHDERDYEFAVKYNLPIIQSVKPMLIQKSGEGAFRPEAKLVERRTIGAVLVHPTEDKLLVLNREKFGRHTFVIGGVEEGENSVDAVKREVIEETGYKDFGQMYKIPFENVSMYYASHKNEGRKAIESVYVIKLNSLDKNEVDESELSKHKPVWMDREAALKIINTSGHGFAANQLANPGATTEYGILTNSPSKEFLLPVNYSYSFLMGGDDISDEDLTSLGIKIVETDEDGDRKILIPFEKLTEYRNLIIDKLEPGFWNEYSNNITFNFIFKFEDGTIRELDLNDANKDEIDTLATQFSGVESVNPYKWLNENEFYQNIINSAPADAPDFNGLESKEAMKAMITWLEEKGIGKRKVNFKIQDWVFSRQRYWGEPIPMMHCEKCGVVPMDEKDLPLVLPDVQSYEPTGTQEGPLANISDWVNVKCPICGGPARRETNTMPQWAGSSWYWLRYMDPHNDKQLVSPEKEEYWKTIDIYIGGVEHVTRHMIYARFWNMFLYDLGYLTHEEPFPRFEEVGLVLAADGRKMSKRRGNVINPTNVIEEFGADALRTYQLFTGPYNQAIAWNENSLKGIKRFIEKVIALGEKFDESYQDDSHVLSVLHQSIKKISEDIENFKFNTAISQMMILTNELTAQQKIGKKTLESLIIMLAPFAPHTAEEIWFLLNNEFSIFNKAKRPNYDESLIRQEKVNLPVQINGKMRGNLDVEIGTSQEDVLEMIKSDEKLSKYITKIKKVIYVQDKIINIIVE